MREQYTNTYTSTKSSRCMSVLLKKIKQALSCFWLLLASEQLHNPLAHVICRLDPSVSQSTPSFLLLQGRVFVQAEEAEHYVKIFSNSSLKLLLGIWQICILGTLLFEGLQNSITDRVVACIGNPTASLTLHDIILRSTIIREILNVEKLLWLAQPTKISHTKYL